MRVCVCVCVCVCVKERLRERERERERERDDECLLDTSQSNLPSPCRRYLLSMLRLQRYGISLSRGVSGLKGDWTGGARLPSGSSRLTYECVGGMVLSRCWEFTLPASKEERNKIDR